ncbi:MAG: hypothetical protein L6R42_009657, partial [Xanthoria sp. 1 TBL-2021]
EFPGVAEVDDDDNDSLYPPLWLGIGLVSSVEELPGVSEVDEDVPSPPAWPSPSACPSPPD